MSSPVITIDQEEPVYIAIMTMREKNIRHLIVTANGEPVGTITQTDLVHVPDQEYALRQQTVASVAESACLIVSEELPLQEAIFMMKKSGSSSVVVKYSDQTAGIISERDVVRFLVSKMKNKSVGEVAVRPVICIQDSDTLYNARLAFIHNKIRHLVVKNSSNEITGILTFRKLLSHIEYFYVNEIKLRFDKIKTVLEAAEHQYGLIEKVIESSYDGIMITDSSGVIKSVNPAFELIFGYTEKEIVGKKPSLLKSGVHDNKFYQQLWSEILENGNWQGEIWNKKKNGTTYPQLLTIAAAQKVKGVPAYFLAIFKDLTASGDNEELIYKMVYNNPLTGLPNYRLICDSISSQLFSPENGNNQISVVHIKINRFDILQESLGSKKGDFIIKVLSSRILEGLREGDLLAHISKQEFILVIHGISDENILRENLSRIQNKMELPLAVGEHQIYITAGFGIAISKGEEISAAKLIENSILANKSISDEGLSSIRFYDSGTENKYTRSILLENKLRNADYDDEFDLFYQPIVHSSNGKIAGFEALIRWNNPELGNITPTEFIPLAESTGLILPVGRWVLERAFNDFSKLEKAFGDIYISVNISIKQLLSERFIDIIKSLIDKYKIRKNSFYLEITENILFDMNIENLNILSELKEKGIQLMIDDFGTGFSSLSYLQNFPVSRVKLDRSFIKKISHDEKALKMADAIVHLAHAVDLQIIIEGVETAEQYELIKNTGAGFIQGYFFGKPASCNDFIKE
jgi:PAS domain S-box-containing protein/diguanylate cyclase (GGDEF)-like protein